jgi:hypothetical protein
MDEEPGGNRRPRLLYPRSDLGLGPARRALEQALEGPNTFQTLVGLLPAHPVSDALRCWGVARGPRRGSEDSPA